MSKIDSSYTTLAATFIIKQALKKKDADKTLKKKSNMNFRQSLRVVGVIARA